MGGFNSNARMLKLSLLPRIVCVIFLSFIALDANAEIRIEYKVTPLKDNPFLEEFEVLPNRIIMTIGEKYVKIEEKKHLSFADQFRIHPIGEAFYYHCISGYGMNNYFKKERHAYDSIVETNELFNVLGYQCKKVIAKKGENEIELYTTEQYGIDFHPYADIKGIALFYIEKDVRFEKVVYEAISIDVIDVEDDFFEISGFRKGKVSTRKKNFLEGKKLKNIKVTTLEGEKVELDFNNGKINVINFWFKGCKPCIQEIPLLNILVDSLKSEEVNFVAISTDDPKVATSFVSKKEFKYDHYAEGKWAADKYAVKSFPTHIVTDEKGVVKYIASGLSSHSIYNLASHINLLRSKKD